MNKFLMLMLSLSLCLPQLGCNNTTEPAKANTSVDVKPDPVQAVVAEPKSYPVFVIDISEYPSWSIFAVANAFGLWNGAEGALSELEKKHGVDVVLQEKDYDTCIQRYGAGNSDASCLANTEVVPASMGRDTTVLIPSSTSNSADAIISIEAKNYTDLKDKVVFGLDKSVSHFLFYEGLKSVGENPEDYTFQGMDPADATQALLVDSPTVKTICVWNPFKINALKKQGATVILDSSKIRNKIIDMVIIGNDSLKKPGGENFAKCICEVFYKMCDRLNDSNTRQETLKALGAKFYDVSPENMAICTKETEFFDTPKKGVEVFNGDLIHSAMDSVVAWNKYVGNITEDPTISYPSESGGKITFDPQYMESVK